MIPHETRRTDSVERPIASDTAARGFARRLYAAFGGAIVCAPPFFLFGVASDEALLGPDVIGIRTILSTVIGAAIGAFLGWGLLNGFVGSTVIWIVGFAIGSAIVGPGCDADPVSCALVGAALGLLFALTKWRGLIILVGGVVGINVGVAIGHSDAAPFLGFGMGGFLGYCVGYLLFPAMSWLARSVPTESHEPPRDKSRDQSRRSGRNQVDS